MITERSELTGLDLTGDRRNAFDRLGFLPVPDLGLSVGDLAEVERLLDALFDGYRDLPGEIAHDRAINDDPNVVRIPEIVRCTELEPRLLATRAFHVVTALADELLGHRSQMVFDHAIFKPVGAAGATSWHQDSAYGRDTGLAVWLPLQATDVSDGCMRYVPFSHLGPNHEHRLDVTPQGHRIWHLDDALVDGMDPVSVPVPLGGANVHARKTIHGAWPNTGQRVRKAWITIFAKRPSRMQRSIDWLRPRRRAVHRAGTTAGDRATST